MTEKRRILQPVNLIVFLILALAAEVVVCLPLFEGANVFLQIGWTGYLLLGMAFFFYVGEKAASVKAVEKFLIDSKAGRFLISCFLFFVCIGFGAAFRMWEISDGNGTISKNVIFNLAYYLIIGIFVYFTAKLISGFKGTIAAGVLIALCPFFDFSAELSVRECMYTLLVLIAIFFISLANYFVEKKSVSLQDTLLTILGAVSLAGATFLHISAVVLIFPCIFLLIRKSGAAMRGKREQRGLRSLLFEVFYICSLAVIFLIYSVQRHTQIVDIPIDYHLFHVIGNIGKESVNVLELLLDKFSGLFAINNQGEYYNGLLMGMLVLGILGAILLFKKKTERSFFPVYLFNWYFFFGLLLKESAYSGLVLYALLAYMVAGTLENLSELVFAGKRKNPDEAVAAEKQEDSAAGEEIEEREDSAASEETEEREDSAAGEEIEEREDFTVGEETEGQISEKKLEMDAALKAAEKKLPQPEVPVQDKPEPEEAEAEEKEAALSKSEEMEPEMESEAVPVPLEKQMQELIKREDRILEIVEKQSAQISKLEEELREQRIRTKKMERHYRKELAITRNKKR